MRIAYVEDNPTNLALVERICGMNHHTVVSYAEGEVAIQQLVREKFDLILMDVELAGEIGGLQVVRHLRRVGLKTPIVAVTAYAMMGDRERCLESGCDDYLPKPLPINELLVLLAKYEAIVSAGIQPQTGAAVGQEKPAATAADVGCPPEPVVVPVVAVPIAPAVPPAVPVIASPVVPAVGGSVGGSASPTPAVPPAGSAGSGSSAGAVSAPVIAPLPVAESRSVETPPAVPPEANPAKVDPAAEPSKPDEITTLHPS